MAFVRSLSSVHAAVDITQRQIVQVAEILGVPIDHLHSLTIGPNLHLAAVNYKGETNLVVKAEYYHLNSEGNPYMLEGTPSPAMYEVCFPVED